MKGIKNISLRLSSEEYFAFDTICKEKDYSKTGKVADNKDLEYSAKKHGRGFSLTIPLVIPFSTSRSTASTGQSRG